MSICIGRDGKPKLCVGKLPGRKRPSLYMWTPLDIHTLATFKDEESADEAARFIENMIGARLVWDGDATHEPVGSPTESRYREALERIANHVYHGTKLSGYYQLRRIAREALSAEESPDTTTEE